MKISRLHEVLIALGTLLWVPLAALSQGSLTPPGAPGPTMKTLTQIEPRTPIESVPFTINSPGSYYLTGNLAGAPIQDGIVIKASHVSVDLKGFTISGCATGIRAEPAANPASITVINGIVTGCSAAGVDLGTAPKCHLEHLLVCNNGGNGANVGAGSIVTLCVVNMNQASGISLGDGSAVFNCVVQSNTADGILVSAQCRAADNVCDANGSNSSQGGIHATGRANRIDNNTCNRNNGHGIKVDGTANLVVRNSVCGSTGADYDIAAGNNYGQILTNPGAGFVNSNPWANFSCGTPVGQICMQDSDCAGLSDACKDGVCLAGQCGTRPKADNTPCPGGVCLNGVCGPAPSCTDMVKNGSETDVDCGGPNCPKCAVGRMCGAGSDCQSGICSGGVCQSSCPAGYSFCGNACIPTSNDPNNCGGCGLACPSRPNAAGICSSSVCGLACNAGYADCNGNMQTDGCEVNIRIDPNNCGGCGLACPSRLNAAATCSSGICGLICNAGYADCNGNMQADGCEVSINTDPNNCGSCGRVCSNNHIQTVSCASGVCNGLCSNGFADCNGNKQADGCEVNTTNDRNNCGGCGIVCLMTQTCIGSVCQ